MVSQKIPRDARYIQTTTEFLVNFNEAINGFPQGDYDFSISGLNNQVNVLDTNINSIYFLNNISVGANIDESVYLDSIVNVPLLSLRRKVQNEPIYQKSIPLVNYFKNQDCSAWFKSDKSGDGIQASLTGILQQVPDLVGITPIKIFVTFGIFAIDNSKYSEFFRNDSNYSTKSF